MNIKKISRLTDIESNLVITNGKTKVRGNINVGTFIIK